MSVAHHNRESVDYIADTTLLISSAPCHLLFASAHFQIRVVVLLRHDGAANLLWVVPVIKHVVINLNPARSLLAYQSNFARNLRRVSLTYLLKIPM